MEYDEFEEFLKRNPDYYQNVYDKEIKNNMDYFDWEDENRRLEEKVCEANKYSLGLDEELKKVKDEKNFINYKYGQLEKSFNDLKSEGVGFLGSILGKKNSYVASMDVSEVDDFCAKVNFSKGKIVSATPYVLAFDDVRDVYSIENGIDPSGSQVVRQSRESVLVHYKSRKKLH